MQQHTLHHKKRWRLQLKINSKTSNRLIAARTRLQHQPT
jgi:hypothetical protein